MAKLAMVTALVLVHITSWLALVGGTCNDCTYAGEAMLKEAVLGDALLAFEATGNRKSVDLSEVQDQSPLKELLEETTKQTTDPKMLELLEATSALITSGQSTPEVKELIQKLIEKIEKAITDAISTEHAETQKELDSLKDSLGEFKGLTLEGYKEALDRDNAWIESALSAERCEIQHSKCLKAEASKSAAKETKCDAAAEIQFLDVAKTREGISLPTTWEVPPFKCDLKPEAEAPVENPCLTQFQEWTTGTSEGNLEHALEAWANGWRSWAADQEREFQKVRQEYAAKHEVCTEATVQHTEKAKECTAQRQTCDTKNTRYDHEKNRRDVSVCVFGSRLQNFCDKKHGYAAKKASSKTVEDSLSKEWATMHLLKCVLNFAKDDKLDKDALEECKEAADNDNSFTPIENHEAAVEAIVNEVQFGGTKFECTEKAFTFSGKTVHMVVTGSGAKSYWVELDFHPQLDLALGAKAFPTCAAAGGEPKTCAVAGIVCTHGGDPKAGETPCVLDGGCTEGDCCTTPPPLPSSMKTSSLTASR